MARNPERIVSYTVDELQAMDRLSNWSHVDAPSEVELEAAIASDPGEAGLEFDWSRLLAVLPRP